MAFSKDQLVEEEAIAGHSRGTQRMRGEMKGPEDGPVGGFLIVSEVGRGEVVQVPGEGLETNVDEVKVAAVIAEGALVQGGPEGGVVKGCREEGSVASEEEDKVAAELGRGDVGFEDSTSAAA